MYSGERPTKLRRLNELRRRLPQVTAKALEAVLRGVGQHGLPELMSRQNMTEARQLLLSAWTPYGPLIQQVDVGLTEGMAKPIQIVHPLAYLWLLFDQCKAWRDLLVKRHQENPSSAEQPWGLVLYTDEVTPGNVLTPDLTRKCQAVYLSFLNFGSAALSREDAWLCVLVHRSSEVRKILGGMAQVVGALLRLMFPLTGTHLCGTGILLSSHAGFPDIRLHARLQVMVQDGLAHKEIWQVKGDSGLRMCLGCDIINSSTDLPGFAMPGALKQNVIRERDLNFFSDAHVRGAARRLSAFYARDDPRIDQIQMALGLNHCRYMLLTDPALTSIVAGPSQFMHDWMHGVFASGVFNILMHHLLTSLEGSGLRSVYAVLESYVTDWRWPHRVKASGVSSIFNSKRRAGNRKGLNFRAGASEGLSIYPVLSFWLQAFAIPNGRAVGACQAFLAFASFADCLVSVGRGDVTPSVLRTAVEGFLQRFADVWGVEYFTPKFHWLLHYARELDQHGTLLSCFVHERKHKCIRRFAVPTLNTKSFEKTVLEEVTCQHLWAVSQPSTFEFDIGLVNPRAPNTATKERLRHALGLDNPNIIEAISGEARFNAFETCQKKDVVLVQTSDGSLAAGEIWLHARLAGEERTILSTWSLRKLNRECSAAVWNVADSATVVPTTDIVASVVWMSLGSGLARTLIPSDLLRHF